MKDTILTATVVLALGAGQATAQPACPNPGRLSKGNIELALVGKWACAKDGADMWNEQLTGSSGSSFQECHSGLSTGPDPMDPNKGTWVTTGNPPPANDPGTITYTYPPSGGSYTYQVYQVTAGATYTFCRPSDGKTYTVHITTCPPPTLNNCP
jgi:hypothetical protein